VIVVGCTVFLGLPIVVAAVAYVVVHEIKLYRRWKEVQRG
jgi:hypothetical protein